MACHNFSDIRRRPLVIGKLDQVRLPFVVTMPQLAMGAIVFGLLFVTRPAWGALMSDRLHIVVFVAAPVLIAQQISRTSIEGRPLSKAVMGLFRLWTAPRYGTSGGKRLGPSEDRAVLLQPLMPDARPRFRRPRRWSRILNGSWAGRGRGSSAGRRSGERRSDQPRSGERGSDSRVDR